MPPTSPRRCCVFGAAGWTGRAVVAELLGTGTAVTAFDIGAQAWDGWAAVDGPPPPGAELRYGDIADYNTVRDAIRGCDSVVHTTVATTGDAPTSSRNLYQASAEEDATWLVNMKGLFNVLQASQLEESIKQVIHIGSCHSVWPGSIATGEGKGERFMDAATRRPDGGLYATQKRLQEEMCRQFHDAHALPVAVFRPDYIVDSRLGIGRHREDLHVKAAGGDSGGGGGEASSSGLPEQQQQQQARLLDPSWVCRHDIAKACRLAIEKEIGFEILHVVDSSQGQAEMCNVGRTERLLGMTFSSVLLASSSSSTTDAKL